MRRLRWVAALSVALVAASTCLGASVASAQTPQSDFDVFDGQSATTAVVGDTVQFSNTVANDGPDAGTGTFTDTVSAEGQIASFALDPSSTGISNCQQVDAHHITCDLNMQPNNDIGTLNVTVNVVAAGNLTNTAEATSATDSNPDNNTATETVTVTGASPTPTTPAPSPTTPPPSGGVQTGAGGTAHRPFPALAVGLLAVAFAASLLLLRRLPLRRR
jgi:hypothetical protein